MSTAAIHLQGLRKTYRRPRKPPEKALDGLDLHVEAGGVHGFLGPNGSGKTTTIRILLGLARADSGQAQILGCDIPRELPKVVARVGALVENPLFLPGISGRAQLRMLGQSVGVDRRRVDEVLEVVGLRDRANDRVKGYSLGMRQRLGIAAALLKDPQLLILDEPSNGLDPAGMKEIRGLIRELGSSGRTVLLCSHLLSEVNQVCDHVSILSRGRCLVQGPVAEVLAAHGHRGARVRIDQPTVAEAILRAAGYDVHGLPDDTLEVAATEHTPADLAFITRILGERGLWLRELAPLAADLESAFLEITADQGLDATPEEPK